ncbi:hypothetical protein E1301_Tti020879 [Triplophysa tibetana]|uniref:Immunoglobulin domain-containing protein n=1 Tax=Triplophysa tibetana TaxID=1572043 RepID=A0A5A9NP35_9TELE|nr:hypothetical protein E1301_Tti020879 [Triplophysa tibetana]
MDLCFIFLAYLPYFIAKGVFGDDVKSVSVMEGDSVTLHTDVVKQRDDLIVWSYGSENTVVAIINGKDISTKLSEDEKFKDTLKLNHQTGDLIISDVRSQHSGLYTLRIRINNKVSYKKFNLTVSSHFPPLNHITKPTQDPENTKLNNKSSKSPDQRLSVITAVSCTAVVCVIIIIIISIIIYIKKRKAVLVKSSESKNHLNDEIISISSISTCEDEESSKCLMKNNNTGLKQDQCEDDLTSSCLIKVMHF